MRVKLVAMAAAAALAGVAVAQSAPKTELINKDGQVVDTLLLRYGFEAMWAVDTQRVLIRDTYLDHYLLTLAEPCEKLEMQDRGLQIFPTPQPRAIASRSYEVRTKASQPCDIKSIRWVPKPEAAELKAEVAAKG